MTGGFGRMQHHVRIGSVEDCFCLLYANDDGNLWQSFLYYTMFFTMSRLRISTTLESFQVDSHDLQKVLDFNTRSNYVHIFS
jgi:hypothetical protein